MCAENGIENFPNADSDCRSAEKKMMPMFPAPGGQGLPVYLFQLSEWKTWMKRGGSPEFPEEPDAPEFPVFWKLPETPLLEESPQRKNENRIQERIRIGSRMRITAPARTKSRAKQSIPAQPGRKKNVEEGRRPEKDPAE